MLSVLALQKPSAKPKTKQLSACLEHRLALWSKGDVFAFVKRACASNSAFRRSPHTRMTTVSKPELFQIFAALDLLGCKGNSGVLHINGIANKDDPTLSSVLDALKSKHPAAVPSQADVFLSNHLGPSGVHPVFFDSIEAGSIRRAALATNGAA